MRDDQTGSIWTHFDGTVLTGPLTETGVRMDLRPLIHTTWEDWTALHPNTLVPIWNTGFEDRYRDVEPGRAGISPRFEDTLLNVDDRLPENELVLGAGVGDSFRAYPLATLPAEVAVTADELGGHPIVVFSDTSADYALAFSAVVDDEVLSFRVEDGRIIDDRGTEWDSTGRAISDALADTQLQFVTSFVTEWYGWSAFYPDTDIYGE
jgi:hypothetical protein